MLRLQWNRQVAQLWQRDRAKLASFSTNVDRYLQTHKIAFLGHPMEVSGAISGLYLKVLTQRNFVAEPNLCRIFNSFVQDRRYRGQWSTSCKKRVLNRPWATWGQGQIWRSSAIWSSETYKQTLTSQRCWRRTHEEWWQVRQITVCINIMNNKMAEKWRPTNRVKLTNEQILALPPMKRSKYMAVC